jgi:hypothetical protein
MAMIGRPMIKIRPDWPDERALHDRRGNPDARQRVPDFARTPVVSITRVQNEHARQRHVRDVVEEVHRAEPEQAAMRTKEPQRADGMRVLPAERAPPLRRQRFRQHEQAVHRVGQAEAGGHPERQPGIVMAEDAAERRADDEADSEGGAHHAE